MIDKIVIASANNNKISQIKYFLKDTGINFLSLLDFPDIKSIEEIGSSFRENAFIKSSSVYRHTKIPSLADDSGLEVDFLNGEPGIYSARYDGLNATDTDNNLKLLEKLKDAENQERTARYVCVLSLYITDEINKFFEGKCDGRIIKSPRGNKGFGYDPIFVPDNFSQTFGELDIDTKMKISHRGKALQQLKEYLLRMK